MTSVATLKVEVRSGKGKGAARELRREKKFPGIIYGGKGEPQLISLALKETTLVYLKGNFLSKPLELEIEGKKHRVLPRDVQLHPVTDVLEHADFLRLEQGMRIKVKVPVKVSNIDKCPGVKRGGVVNVVRHEIELYCDPDHIPHQVVVDVAGLGIGKSVHISHITLPTGAMPVIKRDFTLVSIAGRGKDEDERPAGAAEGAAAATAAGAAAPAAAKPAAKK